MTYEFNPRGGFIPVNAQILGRGGILTARLILDTGATRTFISRDALALIDCVPPDDALKQQLYTASGTISAGETEIPVFAALDQQRLRFPVLCHSLPGDVGCDGVLGLDFFHDFVLSIDFRRGRLALS